MSTPQSESPGPAEVEGSVTAGGDDELLAALADDFSARLRRREHPTIEEYVAKHPALAERIRQVLAAVAMIEQARPMGAATAGEAPGSTIGRYKLFEPIGEGGFGVAYMAEQLTPVRRKVALKVIKPGMDSRQVLARFEAERQALAIMDHPHIAKVFDGGMTDSGRPYFVMELVKGEPITTYCDKNHLPPRARLELFLQVCQAVQHAHQKGIIHRDIKPSNVLVSVHDTRAVVKVIDFGVAKALGQELTEHTLFTAFAQLLGTPLYMSPEQAGQSALDVDTRSDIYSLGVLLYELLTGTTPFDKERFNKAAQDEIRRIIREEEPPRPSTRLNESKETLASISAQRRTEPAKLTRLVRGELDWIVMKALEKDRSRRYETANGLAMDVQRYLADEPVLACPPSTSYRIRKLARRHRFGLAVTALVLLFLILAGGGIGWLVRDRAARQGRIGAQVDLILDEVDRLEGEQNWPEALAAARRAEVAVTGGEAGAATTQRVRDVLKDLEFIDRLEQVHMLWATWVDRSFNVAGADREYARAFREYGVDVDTLSPEESVARLKARPTLAIPLAAAIDEWAQVRWSSQKDAGAAKRLVAVARGIDSDPQRDWMRSTWGKSADEIGEELSRLATSIDIASQHPSTLRIMAARLDRVKRTEAALRLLHDAWLVYPGDFWINFTLGRFLAEQDDQQGAVRFYTAALAIRPDAIAVLNNLGNALTSLGKMDEAIAAYRRAIELDPRFERAYGNLGIALKNQGKVDEAAAVFRKAIELDPRSGASYSNLGNLLKDQGRVDEAVAAHRKAIELDPKAAAAYSNLATALCQQKKLDEAIAACRKAIELDPKFAPAHANLGMCLRQQHKLSEAAAENRKAIELDPESTSAYCNLGGILIEQKAFDEAVAAYRQAIKIDPRFIPAYCGLAEGLAIQERWHEATLAARKAIELDPSHAYAYDTIALILCGQKKWDDALDAARKSLEIDATNPAFNTRLGQVLAAQGKVDEAITAFRRALELDPTSVPAYNRLGAALCDSKRDYNGAIGCFRKGIELDPENAFAYNGLGVALRAQKRLNESVAAFRKAIELDPRYDVAYVNLGGLLLDDKGDLDGALACFRKAVELNAASFSAQLALGRTLHIQNKPDEAIIAYRKAIELKPDAAAVYSDLGSILCDVKKDYDGAVVCFRKAIELDPNFAIAYGNLAVSQGNQGRIQEAIASARRAVEVDPKFAQGYAYLAWLLATCPDTALRDPAQAVSLAKKAVELAPPNPQFRSTLGVAHYRSGDSNAAIAALQISMLLKLGGDGTDWFFVAMANWQLGNQAEARRSYDRAVVWMDKNAPNDEELIRFRAEAAEQLGLAATSQPSPSTAPQPTRSR